MAQTKELIKEQYPLPAYNYRVDVGGTTMSFSQVSGVSIEHETLTYRHGFSYQEGEKITSFHWDAFSAITLKRGTVKGITGLYDWLESKAMRHIDISLCDEAGAPVVTWHVGKAVPTKLEAPEFDASTNDVAVESLEVMAANVSVEHHT